MKPLPSLACNAVQPDLAHGEGNADADVKHVSNSRAPKKGFIVRFSLVRRISNPTSELTRRRDFTQPSPDQLSYETCSRRSRPTICWASDVSRKKFCSCQ